MQVKQTWLAVLCIIALPLLVFFQSLSNEFVALDDELLIIDNPTSQGLSWANVKRAFTTYDPELYIPLTLLTYQLEYALFGGFDPMVVHATNLLLHVVNTLLVFLIFRRFFREYIALLCALLFSVHPLVVETVVWGAARKDLLSSMFFLSSVYLFLQWRNARVTLTHGYWLSVSAFALGLLSKVSIALLPFMLLLLDWYKDGHVDRRSIREKCPYFALAALFVVIALFGKRAQVTDWGTLLLMPFVSVPFYIQKFFLPTKLAILYPFTDAVSFLNVRVLLGMFLLVGISVGAWLRLRRDRLWVALWLLFIFFLLPSFANVLKGSDSGSLDVYFASDRYAYLAILVPLFLVGVAMLRWHKTLYVTCTVTVLFAWLTYQQSMVWKNSERLFQNVIDHYSNSHLAYNNLAGFRAQEGKLSEAEELYRQSLSVKENPRALFSLGRVLVVQEKFTEAVPLFERYVALQSHDGQGYSQLGGLVLLQGETRRATKLLERGRELDFNIPELHYNLGVAYERQGRMSDAHVSFENALNVQPGYELARRKLER
ncbi:hypothetical protein COU77_02730 [Candidatus Peregrinibacteria bacterium CG10_big_fil_rev_8_21_14_0_10_49_16]|nr:MAG: hypothetical protein COW95_02240 [Candidatus Peregrinibacteria bacterium CG22_combo_CG10-13_8_21_14_all_49_11]PIR51954.1 MAG: hypothetical protein COU77_02730 [Candidatus Peregrinibacteria bacterium CG10_big_fil_rev_8_21_14_0_10_49_16]